MKGLIVVHGTSQDIHSTNETTVQIAKAARERGVYVVEIGGPGSTERTILRGIKRNPQFAEYTPINEIGFPLDYAWDMMAGTVTGSGTDDIIEDIRAAGMKMLEMGVSSIDLLGFSRGAVALSLALEIIDKEIGPKVKGLIPINVCLLDPVPGPYFIKKEVKIPSFVQQFMLLTSKHEGRPGFNHLGITVGSDVDFMGDLIMGVHGDIGGSTQSPLTHLIKERVAKFLKLPDFRLSAEERQLLTLEIMVEPDRYTNPGFTQWMSRRGIGWSEHDFEENILELPSAQSYNDLETLEYPREFWKEDQNWQLPLKQFKKWQPQKPKTPKLVVPSRSILDTNRKIIFPPSRAIRPDSSFSKKVVFTLIKKVFKK